MLWFSIWADVLIARNFQNCLHFCYCNHWGYAAKDQIAEKEQTDGTREKADFNPSRTIVTPGGRQEVAGKRGGNDHKAFKPHPYVDHNRDEERPPDAAANFARPKHLRADHIAEHHSKVRPPVNAKYTIVKSELLINVARVPGDEQLSQISHADNRTG